MPEPIEKRGRFRLTAERPQRPGRRAPPVLTGRSGGALLMVDRWPLLLARPATRSPSLQLEQRDRLRQRHRGTRRAAVVAQLLTARTAPWIGAGVGSIALAAGMVLIVFAAARDSSAAYLAGSILAGAGFGAAFLGGLRALAAAIPHQQRAAVMSAFYVAAYTSLSLPAVLAASSSHTSRCPRPSSSSAPPSPRSLWSSPSKPGAAAPRHEPDRARCMTTAGISQPRPRSFGRLGSWLSVRHSLRVEAAAALTLYGLYELTRDLVVSDSAQADAHAHRLVALERSLHLFVEANVQRAVPDTSPASPACSASPT
jgi:hypothetical protein